MRVNSRPVSIPATTMGALLFAVFTVWVGYELVLPGDGNNEH